MFRTIRDNDYYLLLALKACTYMHELACDYEILIIEFD